jgi:hypothetical protein
MLTSPAGVCYATGTSGNWQLVRGCSCMSMRAEVWYILNLILNFDIVVQYTVTGQQVQSCQYSNSACNSAGPVCTTYTAGSSCSSGAIVTIYPPGSGGSTGSNPNPNPNAGSSTGRSDGQHISPTKAIIMALVLVVVTIF